MYRLRIRPRVLPQQVQITRVPDQGPSRLLHLRPHVLAHRSGSHQESNRYSLNQNILRAALLSMHRSLIDPRPNRSGRLDQSCKALALQERKILPQLVITCPSPPKRIFRKWSPLRSSHTIKATLYPKISIQTSTATSLACSTTRSAELAMSLAKNERNTNSLPMTKSPKLLESLQPRPDCYLWSRAVELGSIHGMSGVAAVLGPIVFEISHHRKRGDLVGKRSGRGAAIMIPMGCS